MDEQRLNLDSYGLDHCRRSALWEPGGTYALIGYR